MYIMLRVMPTEVFLPVYSVYFTTFFLKMPAAGVFFQQPLSIFFTLCIIVTNAPPLEKKCCSNAFSARCAKTPRWIWSPTRTILQIFQTLMYCVIFILFCCFNCFKKIYILKNTVLSSTLRSVKKGQTQRLNA